VAKGVATNRRGGLGDGDLAEGGRRGLVGLLLPPPRKWGSIFFSESTGNYRRGGVGEGWCLRRRGTRPWVFEGDREMVTVKKKFKSLG
jgi:hypothetical protein